MTQKIIRIFCVKSVQEFSVPPKPKAKSSSMLKIHTRRENFSPSLRNRERDRQTRIQTDGQTKTECARERDRDLDRYRYKETNRESERDGGTHTRDTQEDTKRETGRARERLDLKWRGILSKLSRVSKPYHKVASEIRGPHSS